MFQQSSLQSFMSDWWRLAKTEVWINLLLRKLSCRSFLLSFLLCLGFSVSLTGVSVVTFGPVSKSAAVGNMAGRLD